MKNKETLTNALRDISQKMDTANERIESAMKTCFFRSEVEELVKEQYDFEAIKNETYQTEKEDETK